VLPYDCYENRARGYDLGGLGGSNLLISMLNVVTTPTLTLFTSSKVSAMH